MFRRSTLLRTALSTLMILGVARINVLPEAYAQNGTVQTMTFDVSTDATTFVLNHVNPADSSFQRGDTFIVEGPIYPGGTIPMGGTATSPSPFNPDQPGAIGKWVCRGTFHLNAAQIGAGGSPFVYSTQYFLFNDGTTLVSEGPEGGATFLRAVIGGWNDGSGASGQHFEIPLGTNRTGLFNLRFQFQLKKQAPK